MADSGGYDAGTPDLLPTQDVGAALAGEVISLQRLAVPVAVAAENPERIGNLSSGNGHRTSREWRGDRSYAHAQAAEPVLGSLTFRLLTALDDQADSERGSWLQRVREWPGRGVRECATCPPI